MKKVSNMTELFDKLNDLKAVFSYGQKIIPVLQSLIDFMRDTIPMLETVNNSIAESTKQIPKASHHINDVTSATELATTEILDIVDIISGDVDNIENILSEEKDKLNRRNNVLEKIFDKLEKNEENQKLIEEYKSANSSVESFDSVLEQLNILKGNVFNITLSLQVQDITSQQLAAVNHLIESVQEKLASLIFELESNELDKEIDNDLDEATDLKISAPQNATFNPDAKYSKNNDSQSVADSIIKSSKASQDEIDKLFS